MVLVFVGAGLLFMALAVPLVRRRVPPNSYYGLRTAETFASERVWYDANVASGQDLFFVGVVTIVGSVVLAMMPGLGSEQAALLASSLLVFGVLALAVRGVRDAKRRAAAQDD